MKLLFILALWAVFPTLSVAQTYRCDVQGSLFKRFLSSSYFVELPQANASAKVFDLKINRVHKAPLDAAAQKVSDAVWRLQWMLEGYDPGGSEPLDFFYTAVLDTSNGDFKITYEHSEIEPGVFKNGSCARIE